MFANQAAGALATAVFLLAVNMPLANTEELGTAQDAFFSRTASDEILGAQRARAVQDFNLVLVEGALHDNSAANTVNGSNFITSGSFADANGMATAIQNSGNNVLIQNATILHIELR